MEFAMGMIVQAACYAVCTLAMTGSITVLTLVIVDLIKKRKDQ